MPAFSPRSLRELETCDPRLQAVARAAIKGRFDFGIVQGYRTLAQHEANVAAGVSQAKVSKHCSSPALAFDFAPYVAGIGLLTGHPAQIESLCERFHIKPAEADAYIREQYTLVAGVILGVGVAQGIALRWGGDWDRDGDTLDNNFDDLGHIEIP